MRHFIANIVMYSVASLIFLTATAFAWMRSAQLVVGDERMLVERRVPSDTRDFRLEELGAGAYVRNCAPCHGIHGHGRDQGPPLGPPSLLPLLPGGREYFIDMVLYGLSSDRWRAPMPRMGHMHDAEIAAALNHVALSFGGTVLRPPFRPDEVAARRGRALNPSDVEAIRPR